MGNSVKTWQRYYNLKASTRDGQDALAENSTWRDGMEALVFSEELDVVEELGEVNIIPDSEEEGVDTNDDDKEVVL